MENLSETSNEKKTKYPSTLKWILFLIVLIILILPFHYIPSRVLIYPKGQLTFSYTLVTESDIESIIERAKSASPFEKQEIYQEPVVRMLLEKGIIRKDRLEGNFEEGYRAGLLIRVSRGFFSRKYEGEMILRSQNSSLKSEKFLFNIRNSEVVPQFKDLLKKNVVIHYIKDYEYVADSIRVRE